MEREDSRRHRLLLEHGGTLPGDTPLLGAKLRVGGERDESACDLRGVASGHDSGFVRADKLAHAVHGWCDDWNPARRGLVRGPAEGLVGRGKDEDIRGLIETLRVSPVAKETNSLFHTEAVGEGRA